MLVGVAVRGFCSRGSPRGATAWVGRNGDIEEAQRREGRTTSTQRGRRERVCRNAVGRGVGWAVKSPIPTQFVGQGGGQRNDTVFVSFGVADEQFVFAAGDVVNGQAQTFA
jgi:hypothetical protein